MFDFWFVQNPWLPVQTEFDKVKGDTLLSICIAGEKSWVLATLCFIKMAFLCVTSLNSHHFTSCFSCFQVVSHSLGMESVHTFVSTVTEKMVSPNYN